ncbi:MAG TPA: sugar phosphate isomerase/epimerase [Bacteroidota bacterium]|nr:sugar phosphate isomerase/epimerase [Bacteroidota bacterium]
MNFQGRNVLIAGFIVLLAGALLCPARTSAQEHARADAGSGFEGPVGLQLYSLRDEMAKDIPGTLKKVHDFGITYVELAGTYGTPPEKFKGLLAAAGLTPVSGHFSYEQLRDHLGDVVREARTFGLQYAGCAWIPHQDPFDEKACKEAAAVFNRAGAAFAAEGIKFFYHTHGYEFRTVDGGTLFDQLASGTNPDSVSFEMDVFWIVHSGQDPVALFKKYGGRFALMHLKDMKKGTPTGLFTGHSDVTNDMALGAGIINIPATLKAARSAGVKWYIIEDESPTATEQIPRSLEYLNNVKF